MADFELDIARWADQTDADIKTFARAFVLALTIRIQSYTPVLTGRLRASIQPSEDVARWDFSTPIMIVTNVEYARRIEYGFNGTDALGRHYHQTGAGMFTRGVSEADDVARQVIQDLK